jgi:hypothetical protein
MHVLDINARYASEANKFYLIRNMNFIMRMPEENSDECVIICHKRT